MGPKRKLLTSDLGDIFVMIFLDLPRYHISPIVGSFRTYLWLKISMRNRVDVQVLQSSKNVGEISGSSRCIQAPACNVCTRDAKMDGTGRYPPSRRKRSYCSHEKNIDLPFHYRLPAIENSEHVYSLVLCYPHRGAILLFEPQVRSRLWNTSSFSLHNRAVGAEGSRAVVPLTLNAELTVV